MVVPDATLPPVLRLVGHPLRWRLVTALAGNDLRVGELAEQVSEPQNLVSYHLRLLRDGGLVTATRSSHDARDRYHHLDLDACGGALSELGTAVHPSLRMVRPDASAPATGQSVLFVCTGNSARSPIAEALLRQHAGDRVHVGSAGTRPRAELHPHAVRVLCEEYGIDVSQQRPRPLDLDSRRYDRVVTLCDRAREVLPPTGRAVHSHWSVADPAASGQRGRSAYRGFVAAAADIATRVRHLVPTLVTTG